MDTADDARSQTCLGFGLIIFIGNENHETKREDSTLSVSDSSDLVL